MVKSLARISTERIATRQADTDEQVIALWLHGKSSNTQAAYAADRRRFIEFVGKPLPRVTLADMQLFSDSLLDLAPSSQSRILSCVRSLLAFAHRIGYLPVNVGAAIRLPKRKITLAERILSESDVQRIMALESNPRNHAILRLLYASGIRASELAALKWRDLRPRDDAGQITVYGKGGKTRAILLSRDTWAELSRLSNSTVPDDPVFQSRKGGHLNRSQVFRIVAAAARRAGVRAAPHWLRHSHASHAIDRGAAITLVRDTLGHSSLAVTSVYTHARPGDSSARYLPV
jgi:integrase/recombinase XerD